MLFTQLFEESHWSPGEFSLSTPTPFSPAPFGGVFSPSPTPKGKPMFDASKLKEDVKPIASSDLEELDAWNQSESRAMDFVSPMAPKHQSKVLTVKASTFFFSFLFFFLFFVSPTCARQKIKTGALETPLSPNEGEPEVPVSSFAVRRSAPGKIAEVWTVLDFLYFLSFLSSLSRPTLVPPWRRPSHWLKDLAILPLTDICQDWAHTRNDAA